MYKTILLSIILLAAYACGQETATNESASNEETIPISLPADLPADFQEFYQKFHADSTYQVDHIQWPLRGIPDQALAEGEVFYFSPDNWSIQRPISATSGYVSQFTSLTDELIVEQIINPQDATSLERRFLKNDDGWRMIYYQGVRKLQ